MNKEEIRTGLKAEFGENSIIKEETVTENGKDIYVFNITNLKLDNTKEEYLDYLDCINVFNRNLSLDYHVRNYRD